MEELREQNLISEFHFRYRRNGGVAYHHIADNYILLFSTFMPRGVWEAVEIMEGLLKIIRMYSLISFMAIHKHNLPLFSRYRICLGLNSCQEYATGKI